MKLKKPVLNTDKVRREMKRRGLSERKAATLIGTSQALLNYWLNHKSLAGVHRIAAAFDFEVKDLIV